MANEKDLSLLTIDGSTYRTVLTNPNIGKEYRTAFDGSATTVAEQYTPVGSPLTVVESGLYHIFVGLYGRGSTTGDCFRNLKLDVNGISDYLFATVYPNNWNVWLSWQIIRELSKDDVLQPKLFSYAPFTYSKSYLVLRRLPKYPDVVGGGNTNP